MFEKLWRWGNLIGKQAESFSFFGWEATQKGASCPNIGKEIACFRMKFPDYQPQERWTPHVIRSQAHYARVYQRNQEGLDRHQISESIPPC